MFQPVKIRYEEDQLRKEFFRDHPWELARPRVVLENSGNDHAGYDWSKLKQRGKRLDGERCDISFVSTVCVQCLQFFHLAWFNTNYTF